MSGLPTGDLGQRFEVISLGYPKPGHNVIGWSSSRQVAEAMRASIINAPGCTFAGVLDRGARPDR